MLNTILRTVRAWLARVFRIDHRGHTRTRKTRRKIERAWHMMDLLDTLDESHGRFKLKYSPYSWVGKSHWRGLRALGAYVLSSDDMILPDPADPDLFTIPEGWSDQTIPSCMHVGVRALPEMKDEDGQKWHSCRAIWAMREPDTQKPPWRVEKTPGVLYVVGFVFELAGKEFSLAGYVSLNFKTKTLHVPRLLEHKKIKLKNGATYCRKEWGIPHDYGECAYKLRKEAFDGPEDAATRVLLSAFRACWEAWQRRDDYYQVSTRRRKSRVTFCISPGEQKFFFKDRDKTVLAADGKRKRIVHYVREHVRVNGQSVKEHLRGVRQFHWHGYDVAVIVPVFHIVTHDFDLPGVAEEDQVPGQKYASLRKVMDKMAKLEDEHEYRHGREH